MSGITVNHNNLPEAVQVMYDELQEIKRLLNDKLETYKSAPGLPEDHEDLLSIQEVCDYLRVKPNTIHRWKRNKSIPYHKFGNRTYFKKSELDNCNKIDVKKPKGLR